LIKYYKLSELTPEIFYKIFGVVQAAIIEDVTSFASEDCKIAITFITARAKVVDGLIKLSDEQVIHLRIMATVKDFYTNENRFKWMMSLYNETKALVDEVAFDLDNIEKAYYTMPASRFLSEYEFTMMFNQLKEKTDSAVTEVKDGAESGKTVPNGK
jgi:hypothetical protein